MTKQLSENDVQGDSKFNRIALVQEVAEIVRSAFKKRWKHTHVGMETSYAIARDILAAMPPQPVDGEWQPIESAPKDGTRFLAGRYRVRISQPNYFEWYVAVYAGECKILTDDEEWGIEGNDGEFYCPEGFYREGLDRYGEEKYISAKPTHWMPVPAIAKARNNQPEGE